MWLLYFLIIYVLLMSFIIDSKTNKLIYLIFVFGLFAFLMMFRSEKVGNDTQAYIYLYNIISNMKNIFNNSSRFEIGYVTLNKIFSFISDDAQILFIFTGALTCFSVGRFIYKYSDIPWLSVYMFLTLQYFDFAFTGVRQIIAVSIILFGYDYIKKRMFIRFLILILLATLFHTSSIFFLIIYPLSKLKINRKLLLSGVFITLIIYSLINVFMKILFRYFSYYAQNYYQGSEYFNNELTLAVLLMLLFIGIIFILSFTINEYKKSDEIDQYPETIEIIDYDKIQAIAIFIGLMTLILALKGTIFERFKITFTIFIITYYPNAIYKIIDSKTKNYILLISVLIFTLYIIIIQIFRPEWQSTYPYDFFWNDR
ncbi:MAG: EpsG family protein [Eubacteriales bacterium]